LSTDAPPINFDNSRSRRARAAARRAQRALPWVGLALALLAVAVLWPLVELVRQSLGQYGRLWHERALAAVALRTGIWVAGTVAVTLIVSLALAQLFHSRFPLRRATRKALVVPWAASLTVTAVVFRWALDPRAGLINVALHGLGLLRLGSADAAWLGRPGWALAWMMAVAVFVSVPLTTYVLLAGLSAISEPMREAADIDGRVPWRRFRSVTLPLLRPALSAAALVGLVTAFNALPIVWEMTRGGSGYRTSISSSFMFSLRATDIGQSAALSVANLVLVLLAVLVFIRVTGSGGDAPRAQLDDVRTQTGRGPRSGMAASAASVTACLFALILLSPYLEMVIAALRPRDQMFAANLLPTHFSLANFTAVWDQGIGHSLSRSLVIAGGATLLVLLTAIPAALYSGRRRRGGRPAVLVVAVAVQLLSPVVLLDGIERATKSVALPSTTALIIIDAGFNLGFALWILHRGFRSLPPGLAEAARIDNLPPAVALWRVKLRPAAGPLLTALVFTFVSAWNELSAALVLTDAGTSAARPLTVVINDRVGQAAVQWGHLMAACVIASLPAIVLIVLIEGQLARFTSGKGST
jgi:ABC-type sugar transport system permease subunit